MSIHMSFIVKNNNNNKTEVMPRYLGAWHTPLGFEGQGGGSLEGGEETGKRGKSGNLDWHFLSNNEKERKNKLELLQRSLI